MNTQSDGHLVGNLTLDAMVAAREELRVSPPPFEIWVASYGPEGMNVVSLPAVSALGGGIEHRYSHSVVDRVVIMRRAVLDRLLADGVSLEGIPTYFLDVEEQEG